MERVDRMEQWELDLIARVRQLARGPWTERAARYDRDGSFPRENLDDYDHWPVRRDLFRQNYRAWNEPGWKPNAAELHLITHGCRPYYKKVGVWAQCLQHPMYVQSLESPRPALIPPGRWLCIGVQGEPYHMNDREFRSRYIVPEDEASPHAAL